MLRPASVGAITRSECKQRVESVLFQAQACVSRGRDVWNVIDYGAWRVPYAVNIQSPHILNLISLACGWSKRFPGDDDGAAIRQREPLNGSRATAEERYVSNWVRWPLADQQILWRAWKASDVTHSMLRHLSFERHNGENLHLRVKGWKGHRRETRRAAVEPLTCIWKAWLVGLNLAQVNGIYLFFHFFSHSHVIQTRKKKRSGYKWLPWCCCWEAWMQMVIVLERYLKKRTIEWFPNNILRQNLSQGWVELQRAPLRWLKMKSSDCFTRQCSVSTNLRF